MRRAILKPTTFILAIAVYAAAGLVTNSQTTNKSTATTNVKIRQRMSSAGGSGVETVLYIKSQRMRNEMAGGSMGFTTILQCDLKRTLTINEKTKTYMISPTDGMNAPTGTSDGGASSAPAPQNQPQRGGVVNVTNTITDTGERREDRKSVGRERV